MVYPCTPGVVDLGIVHQMKTHRCAPAPQPPDTTTVKEKSFTREYTDIKGLIRPWDRYAERSSAQDLDERNPRENNGADQCHNRGEGHHEQAGWHGQ